MLDSKALLREAVELIQEIHLSPPYWHTSDQDCEFCVFVRKTEPFIGAGL